MTENTLRTLKDLEKEIKERTGDLGHVTADNLKEEAIKHVKFKETSPRLYDRKIIKWIKHFFNITEEELI